MSRGLREQYDSVTENTVPDDFMELLEKADKRRSPAS